MCPCGKWHYVICGFYSITSLHWQEQISWNFSLLNKQNVLLLYYQETINVFLWSLYRITGWIRFCFCFFYSLSYSNPISSIMMLKLTLSLGCTSLIFYTYLSEVQQFPGDLYQLCPVHKPWTCFVIQVIMHSWPPGGRYSMMNDSWKLAKCVFDHSGKKGLTATYLHFLKNIGFCWSLTAVLFFP